MVSRPFRLRSFRDDLAAFRGADAITATTCKMSQALQWGPFTGVSSDTIHPRSDADLLPARDVGVFSVATDRVISAERIHVELPVLAR